MSSDPASGGPATRGQVKLRRAAEPPTAFERRNVFLLSLVVLCLIVFSAWFSHAAKRYRETYAQTMEGSSIGSTREVELTLVREDKHNLACASDETVAGLRCGHRQNGEAVGAASPDDPQMLQPFNTVRNELLLAAGMWTSLRSKESLPHGRFSIICNYRVKGTMKSPSIRFDHTATFGVVGRAVTVGTLSDCVLPP